MSSAQRFGKRSDEEQLRKRTAPGMRLPHETSCCRIPLAYFRFQAHERGDANRSGRVERPFHFIENNFLAGRAFSSWEELNQQARQWCDRVNATYKKHIRAVPRELFVLEQRHLRPLPVWIVSSARTHGRRRRLRGPAL